MSTRYFLDTNIIVYALDPAAPKAKRAIARRLLAEAGEKGCGAISWQVVQEFFNVAIRKMSQPITPLDAHNLLTRIFEPLEPIQPTASLLRDALDIQARYRISWYDALIVSAASMGGCKILYSEDLQHGALIHGVRIENPFRAN